MQVSGLIIPRDDIALCTLFIFMPDRRLGRLNIYDGEKSCLKFFSLKFKFSHGTHSERDRAKERERKSIQDVYSIKISWRCSGSIFQLAAVCVCAGPSSRPWPAY